MDIPSNQLPIVAGKEDRASWRAARTPENSSKLNKLCRIRKEFLKENDIQPYSGNFWELVCYPMNSKLFSQVKEAELIKLVNDLKPLLESAIPEYPDDLEELVPDSQPPEPVSLLSSSGGKLLVRNSGDRVVLDTNTFRGKYVLICCFHVPVVWGSRGFHLLISLCEELYSTRDDFEMVMVARMNSLADTQVVFDHFYSGFPESCLAVPYEDKKRRDLICTVLGLGSRLECIQCRFFNADGIVLPYFCPDRILNSYGAEAFPFTEEIMYDIDEAREKLRHDELNELLKPPPDAGVDDVVVSQFNPNPAGGWQLLSEVIRGKHVGLYMCTDGGLIPQLRELHDECREKQLDFEIVVLYCPMVEMLDPKLHKEKTDRLLEKHNVCSWWCLPFNNSVSMRFHSITSLYDIGSYHYRYYYDKLIIVGRDGRILDMYGAEVIYRGIDAYPFTREACIADVISKVEDIRLKSLFVEAVYRGDDPSKATVTVDELLKGKKKIIIYMDSLERLDPPYLDGLVSIYHDMKKMHGDEFEVVFFDNLKESSLKRKEGVDLEEVKEKVIHEMPWYVHPDNGTHSPSLLKLVYNLGWEALFGFGVDDGKLCSIKKLGFDEEEICLEDTLHDDIECLLNFNGYNKDL